MTCRRRTPRRIPSQRAQRLSWKHETAAGPAGGGGPRKATCPLSGKVLPANGARALSLQGAGDTIYCKGWGRTLVSRNVPPSQLPMPVPERLRTRANISTRVL